MSASRARSKRPSIQLIIEQQKTATVLSAQQNELEVSLPAMDRHGSIALNTPVAKSREDRSVEATVLTRSKSRSQCSQRIEPKLNEGTHVDDGMEERSTPVIPAPKYINSFSVIEPYLFTAEQWILRLSGCEVIANALKKLFLEARGGTAPPGMIEDGIYMVLLAAYFVHVWYKVLIFLDKYYLQKLSPTDVLKDNSDFQRYVIYSSYLLIDLVYPITMVGLIHMQLTYELYKKKDEVNKLEADHLEADRDKLTAVDLAARKKAAHRFQAAWSRIFVMHLMYGVFHVGVLFGWLTTKSKHSSIHLSIHSSVHSSIDPFVHPSIHPSMHL